MLKIANAEHYLGEASGRFFSAGYRNVSYLLQNEKVTLNEVNALLTLNYPDSWSVKKNGKALKPHLSSIDVLIVAANLCSTMLDNHKLSVKHSIRQITVVAAKTPVEDLQAIPVYLQRLDSSTSRQLIEGSVGNMRVKIVTQALSDQITESQHSLLDPRFMQNGYKQVQHDIQQISIKNSRQAEAKVRKTDSQGVCSVFNLIDAFVTGMQLGQIMLYEMDQITRRNSSNLWMRSISITDERLSDDIIDDMSDATNMTASLDNVSLTRKAEQSWRCADIVASINHIHFRCSVAHQINTGETVCLSD